MTIVTIDDAINAGLCATGFVRWAKSRGIPRAEIRKILADGIPLEKLERINDPFACRVCEYVKAREANRG